ncbi:MAG: hypothetical protein NTV86_17415, partial [Planctomycetota bacterium]|nr:hypothetical protein [Planctomycetota bacterium]
AATPDAAKRAAAACIPIRKGLAWMDRHFPRDRDALSNNQAYYLYVVSRVGLASEKQTFGKTNWASWGTQVLLDSMRGPWAQKTCPKCGKKFDPGVKQCWDCKVDLPTPPIPPTAPLNWNDTVWDTSMSLLFLVNAERAKNP